MEVAAGWEPSSRERWYFCVNGKRLEAIAHRLSIPPWRRVVAEGAFLAALGLMMGVIGPYGTIQMPGPPRMLYWLVCIVGGGGIGVAVDEAVGQRMRGLWARVAATSLLMTPPVTGLVLGAAAKLAGYRSLPRFSLELLWQVLVISALVMTLRALAWRQPRTVVETRVVIAPPLPEAEAAFRNRLSARRRGARLIAIEAEDHYLRVHTDAGEELLTLRFADALKELARADGFQTHRSWWVAADAIEGVRWRSGLGEARLAGGLTAPISRTHAATVKAAGWF